MAFRNPSAIAIAPAGGSLTNLSDHNRTPINEEREERAITVTLANGTLRKYVQSIKHKWSVDWTWLPDADGDTVDGYAGRETMRGMFATATSGDIFTLTIRDRAASGGTQTRTYTVFIESYGDEITKRDPVLNKYFFSVKLSLREV